MDHKRTYTDDPATGIWIWGCRVDPEDTYIEDPAAGDAERVLVDVDDAFVLEQGAGLGPNSPQVD